MAAEKGKAGATGELAISSLETQALLDMLLSRAPVGIGFVDTAFRFVRINDELAAIDGLAVAEHLGRTVAEVAPNLWPRLEPLYRRVLGGESVRDMEISGETAAHPGSLRHWLASYYPVRSGDEIVGIGIIVNDITERKRSGEERQQIFERITDAFVALDREWRYTYVNEKAAQVFGRPPQELVGRHIWTEFPEGMGQKFHLAYERAMAEQRPVFMEEYYPPYDRWFENRIYPSPEGVTIYFHDITERKRQEDAVRRERDFSDALIDSLPGVLYLYDRDLTFLRWNRNFERVTGYGADEIARMSPLDFFAGAERELLRTRIEDVFATGASSVEAEFVSRDGTRTPYFFTGLRTEIDGRICLLGMGIDISARKRLEDELNLLNRDLEARVAERTGELEETKLALLNLVEDLDTKSVELTAANERLKEIDRLKSMFIASMSHELRTPLNSIIGFSSVLLKGWAGPINDEQRLNLATVQRAGKHLLSLINDVIDVSKIEAGQIESRTLEFDLGELIAEAAGVVEPDARDKGLAFRVEGQRCDMRTDRRRLLQCLLNLLSNAVKYTESGGVRIDVALLPRDASGPDDGPGLVEITVADTGIGIEEKDIPLLFDSFTRLDSHLKATVPGTGLGLYLTRKIAREILDGEVTVTSTHGSGSRFTLRIPATRRNGTRRSS